MKKIVIFLVGVVLFGANLINVNFFESAKKIDILFSLDSPFKGKVKQNGKNTYVITDISSDRVMQKEFKKSFINSVIISPYQNGLKIEIITDGKISTNVALTPDGYGLRFRIENQAAGNVKTIKQIQNSSVTMQGFDMFSYSIALGILILLALGLFYIKKKSPKLPISKENMRVLYQKPIDPKNKVVLFEYGSRKYLMLVGNTNVLLDVFTDDIPVPKNEVQFDEMLKLSKKYDSIEKYIKNAEQLKGIDETV